MTRDHDFLLGSHSYICAFFQSHIFSNTLFFVVVWFIHFYCFSNTLVLTTHLFCPESFHVVLTIYTILCGKLPGLPL